MAELHPDNLRLTDFMDLPTLQEIQDSFAAIAGVKATITDADGNLLTQPVPTNAFMRRQRALADEQPQRQGGVYVAPIMVNDQRLGTIRMSTNGAASDLTDSELGKVAKKFGLDPQQVKSLAGELNSAKRARPAAIQFLFLLANAI